MSIFDREVILELLKKALDEEGINDLALSRFPEQYDNFVSGMAKNTRIRHVIDAAQRNGRLPELLAYMQRHFTKQYALFEPHLLVKEEAVAKTHFSSLRFYAASEIGFVASSTGYVSKLQLRGSLVNSTDAICTLISLEANVTTPTNEILILPWKLFYKYLPGGKIVDKEIDVYPINVKPVDYREPLLIEFESTSSLPSNSWIVGRYQLQLIAIIQNRGYSGSKVMSNFSFEIDPPTQEKLVHIYDGPTIFSIPIQQTFNSK